MSQRPSQGGARLRRAAGTPCGTESRERAYQAGRLSFGPLCVSARTARETLAPPLLLKDQKSVSTQQPIGSLRQYAVSQRASKGNERRAPARCRRSALHHSCVTTQWDDLSPSPFPLDLERVYARVRSSFHRPGEGLENPPTPSPIGRGLSNRHCIET